MDKLLADSSVMLMEPLNINLADLMRNSSYEGKFIVYRYRDCVADEITLLACSSNAKELRKYMDSLNDSSLFITNIPKQTGVYFLGGE